jgi:hypothetical protein
MRGVPVTERIGDELEPPTNPGKPTEGGGRGLTAVAVVVVVVVIVVGGIVLAGLLGGQDRPSPDEFCAGHGGVRYLDAGGWATPAAATCRDGHAGKVYP